MLTVSLEHAITLLIMMLVAQLPALITSVVTYLKNKTALAENTRITKKGSRIAAGRAKRAAEIGSDTMDAVEGINKKLNGGLDQALQGAIGPVHAALQDHSKQDEKDLQEVKDKFQALQDYVHQRNHDILDAINAQSLKIDLALKVKSATP